MENMANEDIDKFCEDGLLLKDYRNRYKEFLTSVKVATRGKNTIKDSSCYKLETYHDTYRYRKALLKVFIAKKKSENFKLTHTTIPQFFRELEGYTYAEEAADKRKESESGTSLVNVFGQDDFKVEGVVIRKTNREAWILVNKTCMFNGKKEYEKVELLLDLETFGADDVSRAFLKVGDILEIAKGPKGTEIALEPEITW